jgi:hypothetical protein
MRASPSEKNSVECPTPEELDEVRSSVSRDGTTFTTPSGLTIVEWAEKPHFYGVGNLLVLTSVRSGARSKRSSS